LTEASGLVAERVGGSRSWELVYQSRSGPPHVPWLEPDVSGRLPELAAEGATDVVLVPIGFVSDHVEVQYDLDVTAAATAADAGLNLVRAATVGAHPRFVAMIRDLVLERTDPDAPRLALGSGPVHDRCAPDCCRPSP
ncbi:MAG: ferrochelatase, partial [Nitriliruptorales bacterium]